MKATLTAFVLFTSSNVALAEYYENYYMPDSVTNKLKKLTDNDRIKYIVHDNLKALDYLYTNSTVNTFSGVSNLLMTVNKDGYLQVNKMGEYNGQCVSFVKAVTGLSDHTSTWRPDTQVGVGYIPIGTAVAVFKGNKYAYHTGIYMGIQDGNMYILDQNWVSNSTEDLGYVSFHPIKLKTRVTKGNGDVNNAYSYFTIRVEK